MIIKIRTGLEGLNPTRVLQNKRVRRNAERFLAKLRRSPITGGVWITADGKVVRVREPSCLYFKQFGDVIKIERSIYWYPGLTE